MAGKFRELGDRTIRRVRGRPAAPPVDLSRRYQIGEGLEAEVYVEPYPGPGSRDLLSSGSGLQPLWRRDGLELFYLERAGERVSMMAVAVTASDSAPPGRSRSGVRLRSSIRRVLAGGSTTSHRTGSASS